MAITGQVMARGPCAGRAPGPAQEPARSRTLEFRRPRQRHDPDLRSGARGGQRDPEVGAGQDVEPGPDRRFLGPDGPAGGVPAAPAQPCLGLAGGVLGDARGLSVRPHQGLRGGRHDGGLSPVPGRRPDDRRGGGGGGVPRADHLAGRDRGRPGVAGGADHGAGPPPGPPGAGLVDADRRDHRPLHRDRRSGCAGRALGAQLHRLVLHGPGRRDRGDVRALARAGVRGPGARGRVAGARRVTSDQLDRFIAAREAEAGAA